MRLFIAVNFIEKIKDQLCGVISYLKDESIQGNFTRRDNLHLTVVFIGETGKINEVKRSMDVVSLEPFTLEIGGLGKFRRSGGDIYWIGVKKDSALSAVYNQLYDELEKLGFRIESRGYTPHLTLGREVILKEQFDRTAFEKLVPEMDMKVDKISLMKSERVNGRLTYTEIYTKKLV